MASKQLLIGSVCLLWLGCNSTPTPGPGPWSPGPLYFVLHDDISHWRNTFQTAAEKWNKHIQRYGIVLITEGHLPNPPDSIDRQNMVGLGKIAGNPKLVGKTRYDLSAKDSSRILEADITIKKDLKIQLSADRSWLLRVATHELGHFLGLGESEDTSSIMHKHYDQNSRLVDYDWEIPAIDRANLAVIYCVGDILRQHLLAPEVRSAESAEDLTKGEM